MGHNVIIREYVFDLINKERMRQEILHPIKKYDHFYMLAVLTEELGEVAQALQDGTNAEEEIIQVAAVCLRWLENWEATVCTKNTK
jgi:NTP pyrophosphatase (non-canonical NTP hydrolase)